MMPASAQSALPQGQTAANPDCPDALEGAQDGLHRSIPQPSTQGDCSVTSICDSWGVAPLCPLAKGSLLACHLQALHSGY